MIIYTAITNGYDQLIENQPSTDHFVAFTDFIHNLINAAGGQADHQIIQRMGRGLRTADDKEGLNYHDFIFDINPYLLEHSNKRIKILKEQGHTVTIKEKIEF